MTAITDQEPEWTELRSWQEDGYDCTLLQHQSGSYCATYSDSKSSGSLSGTTEEEALASLARALGFAHESRAASAYDRAVRDALRPLYESSAGRAYRAALIAAYLDPLPEQLTREEYEIAMQRLPRRTVESDALIGMGGDYHTHFHPEDDPFCDGTIANRIRYRRALAIFAERAARPQAPAVLQPSEPVCVRCGYSLSTYPCVMSDDGEGPHVPGTVEPISAADAAVFERIAVHLEQGAREVDG